MTGSVIHTLPNGDQIQIQSTPGAAPKYFLNGVLQNMKSDGQRFILAGTAFNPYLLMISDYMWWTDQERDILNWMAENLPRGIEHQQGMVLTFETDQQRLAFLLRWS